MRSYLDTAHEYTHMAMREKGRSDIFNTWTVEGIASYLGNMMSDYPTEFLLYALQRYIGSGDIMADRVYALIADGKAPTKQRSGIYSAMRTSASTPDRTFITAHGGCRTE